ncbi:MAG: hypothetical protein AAB549_02650, partial [Patescibacteria group bacterium]
MSTVKKLTKQAVIYIEPTKPFSFKGTFFKPSHFPSRLVLYENNKIYQAIEVGSRVFGIEIFVTRSKTQKVGVAIYARKPISESLKKAIKQQVVI